MPDRTLVLASTSPYRKELLARLGLPFEVHAPEVDETPSAHELPKDTALRLAQEKARAAARRFPDALIIGSDQVAHRGSEVFGKPGNHERAVQQLQTLSGSTVDFVSALCLLDAQSGYCQVDESTTRVTFRSLEPGEIERYLRKDQPYNCAGSAKSEQLGVSLMSSMHTDDPTALVGLPLIRLCGMLREAGITIP